MQESSLTLLSPSDGVLSEFEKKVGASVNAGDWLGSVFQPEDMSMYATVDDTDMVLIQVGAPATVTVDALPDQVLEGSVENIYPSGKNEQGVSSYDVYIRVVGNSNIKSGMQAKAHIGAANAEDVMLVPLEAIFREDGVNKVEVLDPDGTVRVAPVEVGLMNNQMAEILSGLEVGEQVITGSSADLLASESAGGGNSILPTK